jgi:PhzF family phenazine biosynthesis protein
MQGMAADFGVETLFVLPGPDGTDARLRYFVPRHEMEMCVHATVAGTILLAQAGRLNSNPARVDTPLGIVDVGWDLPSATAVVSQFRPVFGPVVADPTRVLAALGLAASALAGPVRSVSTARAKLMIPIRDEATLDRISPDFELLWTVCDELDITGFYPFTVRAAGADSAARQFPLRSGYHEDPATGVAACGLGAYLALRSGLSLRPGSPGWHTWRIAQGRAMGRPSIITAEAQLDQSGAIIATRVGGWVQSATAPNSYPV